MVWPVFCGDILYSNKFNKIIFHFICDDCNKQITGCTFHVIQRCISYEYGFLHSYETFNFHYQKPIDRIFELKWCCNTGVRFS